MAEENILDKEVDNTPKSDETPNSNKKSEEASTIEGLLTFFGIVIIVLSIAGAAILVQQDAEPTVILASIIISIPSGLILCAIAKIISLLNKILKK